MCVKLQIPSHISQQDLTEDEGNWKPTDDRLDKDNFATEWNRTVFAQQVKCHWLHLIKFPYGNMQFL